MVFMFGEEEFLLEEAYTTLIDAAVDRENPMAAFNVEVFDGSDLSQETLVEMASAFPMMAERRVVVVKHFEKMNLGRGGGSRSTVNRSKTKKNTGNSDGAEAEQPSAKLTPLERYAANPSPSTLVVLIADAPELSGLKSALGNPKQQEKAQKKLKALKYPYSMLIERCEWIEFPKLYDREIPSWVADRFKALGREITRDACELLVAQSGESLRDLHNEMEKILTFVKDQRKITRDEIVSLIGASKTYNIFELQKAVGLRNLPFAIEIMRRMLVVDRQELLIISMLTRYFMILWKLSEAITITRNPAELSKTVNISPFFVPEYVAALAQYPPPAVERALYALCEADVTIKSSSESGDVVLQKMLMKIVG